MPVASESAASVLLNCEQAAEEYARSMSAAAERAAAARVESEALTHSVELQLAQMTRERDEARQRAREAEAREQEGCVAAAAHSDRAAPASG